MKWGLYNFSFPPLPSLSLSLSLSLYLSIYLFLSLFWFYLKTKGKVSLKILFLKIGNLKCVFYILTKNHTYFPIFQHISLRDVCPLVSWFYLYISALNDDTFSVYPLLRSLTPIILPISKDCPILFIYKRTVCYILQKCNLILIFDIYSLCERLFSIPGTFFKEIII